MLPEIAALLIVQDRDHKIQQLEKELEKIPRDAENAKLRYKGDAEAVANAKTAQQENAVAIKGVELDIKTRKDTIAKLKTQQFETKKNEEYTALGAEVIRYTDTVDELETQELELMEEADTLTEKLKQAEEKLVITKQHVEEELAQLKERSTQSKARLTEQKAERKDLVKDVNPSLLAMYDRLFKTKGNGAVSPLVGNQCGGCHMKVVPATVSKAIAEEEVTQCENCSCFLYST
eukprot:Seg19605.1 transcript_id=Seg19605.1/GoldUCD/mRNA.D3Y31 product="hypothetical protein" protein_id=Seg19605.1/GoldUCD/D3Y31